MDGRTDNVKTVYPPTNKVCEGYNKLGRGPLGDASYSIPKLKVILFQKRIFFHLFPNIGLSKTCDPEAEPFLAPGIYLEQTC